MRTSTDILRYLLLRLFLILSKYSSHQSDLTSITATVSLDERYELSGKIGSGVPDACGLPVDASRKFRVLHILEEVIWRQHSLVMMYQTEGSK